VWSKTADEILDTLAAYCQRINEASSPDDSGAWLRLGFGVRLLGNGHLVGARQ
jgi:hypothetical protein